ncbi:hypothetical protein Plim_2125 [Planctopirus limnophila DSM 3776]|uniref:Uncharacterized protein n=1 Tax=Planctopirus limnophila (strain ATCC 43296 / DSM 3776 / IFAM 1008 / Mu 290) TaxID=521674 RepID=D5SMP7_PLAL2|nr:hypothetical protein [Planctopirus limnophila]ADG67952.1 hypothetical protein Plim_2125 [Planctopirus limnophila DSM 3776]
MPLPNLKDAALQKSFALPNGAASTVSAAILVNAVGYEFTANTELLIEAPALTTARLPDTQTVSYALEQSVDEAFTSPVPLHGTLFTQTGADGAGALAASDRVRLPSDVLPWVRLKATKTGAANASGASATLSLVF